MLCPENGGTLHPSQKTYGRADPCEAEDPAMQSSLNSTPQHWFAQGWRRFAGTDLSQPSWCPGAYCCVEERTETVSIRPQLPSKSVPAVLCLANLESLPHAFYASCLACCLAGPDSST
jgi:hypothetical protein